MPGDRVKRSAELGGLTQQLRGHFPQFAGTIRREKWLHGGRMHVEFTDFHHRCWPPLWPVSWPVSTERIVPFSGKLAAVMAGLLAGPAVLLETASTKASPALMRHRPRASESS